VADALEVLSRAFRKVVVQPSGCWIFMGATSEGYGQVGVEGRLKRVHRLAYEFARGEIPAGLVIDHICRVRACANPWHLRAVSARDNLLADGSLTIVKRNADKRRCPSGHSFDATNTYLRPDGKRVCRTCKNEQQRARRSA